MVESSPSRMVAFAVGGLAIVLLVASLTWTVVHQIERGRDVDYAWVPASGLVVPVTFLLAILLIFGGFSVMRRAPSLGAFLVVVASAAFAATVFWTIVAPLVAIAVSVYAIRHARRLHSEADVSEGGVEQHG